MFKKFISFLISRNTPTVSEQEDGLQYWRERILQSIYFIAAIFGLVVCTFGSLYALSIGLWFLSVFYTIFYLLIVVLFVSSKISYRTRALTNLIILYSLSIVLAYNLGPSGGAPIWMLTFSYTACTLFGLRAAYISISLNALLLAIMAVLAAFNMVPWALLMPSPLVVWLTMSIILLFLNIATAIPLTLILRGLESTLKKEKFGRDLIEKKNQYLNEANETLLELSESLSDDIKTPLWKICRNSEVLLEKGYSPESLRFVKSIHYQSNKMLRMARNTLLITKNTKDAINRSAVDLASIALASANDIREQFHDVNFELKVERPLIVQADVDMITVFVENLFLMAIENHPTIQIIKIILGKRNLKDQEIFFVQFNFAQDESPSPDYDEIISLTKLLKSSSMLAVRRIIKLHEGFIIESADKLTNTFLIDFTFGSSS